jgi:hypothetical protein
MGQYQTGIITDVSQVPEGYVQLVKFADRRQPGGKTIHKALSEAHQRGDVRAVKLMRTLGDAKTGPVYVHRGDAESILRQRANNGRTGRDADGRIVAGDKAKFKAEDAVAFATPSQAAAAADDLYGAVDDLRGTMSLLCDRVETLTRVMEDLTAAVQLRSEQEGSANGVAADCEA